MDGHVRCMVGIAVWGRMYGNREFGGEPGSLLLYIIVYTRTPPLNACVVFTSSANRQNYNLRNRHSRLSF